MMKYLITGAKGQLGTEFSRRFEQKGTQFIAIDREKLDIGNLKQVIEVFSSIKPSLVINCAAYNNVDGAEKEYALAYKVNAVGVKNLAYACSKYNSFLVHYSTDYVFDGTKEGLYNEADKPNPLSQYAKSKLLGEIFLEEELENYLIFRTSWVYGEGKQNFLHKLTHWANSQQYLKIACDEFSVPTLTKTIVDVTLKALQHDLTGLYHLVSSGYASRYEWAKEFLRLKGIDKFIYPVYQADFNLPAIRPLFSVMDNNNISKKLGISIPLWQDELEKWLILSNSMT